jgi:SAM-dependent methyltransferase
MADSEQHARQAASFGAAAESYERGRPGYPDAALDWIIPAGARRVLDLGAGTGKLTRQLVARGLEVVAVDPSEGMLEQLRAAAPGVEAVTGSAERIPLADGAVDLVTVAQAWHWVDPATAAPEVARVLRPGGRLGLVWNRRDDRSEWVAALGETLKGGFRHDFGTPTVGPPFGPLEQFDTEWSYDLDTDQLLDLVTSRSYVIGMPDPEREAALERVRGIAASELERTGSNLLSMPYVTQSFRAHV